MVIRFKGAAAVLAAASLAISPPASAQQQGVIYVQTAPPAYMNIERVSYGDLNLASRAGEQSLNRRVGRAVERVCLYDPVRWYGLAEPDYNYCKTGAWQRARPQVIGAVYRARMSAYGRSY